MSGTVGKRLDAVLTSSAVHYNVATGEEQMNGAGECYALHIDVRRLVELSLVQCWKHDGVVDDADHS